MAGRGAPSWYVKLRKEQAPAEDITPGELNQPVNNPQLKVNKCGECNQVLPESYESPSDEDWTTGIFGCIEDPESCMTGLFCPCVLYGRNVQALNEEDMPWTRECTCHAICVEGGVVLAAVTAFYGGSICPQFTPLIFEYLLAVWWFCAISTGYSREKVQNKYHLKSTPCNHCLVHCCLHWCALCQEHRAMKNRLSETDVSLRTVVNPPPVQEMNSEVNNESATSISSSSNHQHSNMELVHL